MQEAEISATFGPETGDRGTLSKSSRVTLDALYRHPLAHNLEWTDVIALFGKIGTVEHKLHHEIAFGIGGQHHVVHRSHMKDLTNAEVMDFRHILSRAGWSPATSARPADAPLISARQPTAAPGLPDLLAVVGHHEARLYHFDIESADLVDHVIRPYDPHHILRHPSHKDQSRERGQRAPGDYSFNKRIAEAVSSGRRIVLIGHGHGHSNEAHHLAEHLRLHHPEIFQHVTCEMAADLSSLTAPQLLSLGRTALTAGSSA